MMSLSLKSTWSNKVTPVNPALTLYSQTLSPAGRVTEFRR